MPRGRGKAMILEARDSKFQYKISYREQTTIKWVITVLAPCFFLLRSGDGGGARCANSRRLPNAVFGLFAPEA
jgi:hypothetical protein